MVDTLFFKCRQIWKSVSIRSGQLGLTFFFIISIVLLASAYYMVTGGIEKLMQHSVSILLLPIGLGVLGTILFFYSLSGMILKILSKMKV